MRLRLFTWLPAALVLLLPLSLAGGDVLFYQCVDDEGTVHFTDATPLRGARCIELGRNEERAELDNRIRNNFMGHDGPMPALTGNVVQNSEALRAFHGKLEDLSRGRGNSVTVYFVGDSHLQSGDFVKGFLDVFELNHQVDRALLCVHKVRKVRVRIKSGSSRKWRTVARLPKNYPKGVPRICSSLLESEPPTQPALVDDHGVDPASAAPAGGTSDRRGINVYAYGVSGKTFEYFAGSELLRKDLVSRKPDLIVVMLGTNDAFGRPEPAKIKHDIADFVGAIRSAWPASEVLFVSPPDSFFKNGRDNEYIGLVRAELQTIALAQNFAFWDLYAVMGGPRSMAKWQEQGLSQKDRIHFLADGYKILGRLFYQALVQ